MGVIKRKSDDEDYSPPIVIKTEPDDQSIEAPSIEEEYDLDQSPEKNMGFRIMPLDPLIYGKKKKKKFIPEDTNDQSLTYTDSVDSHRQGNVVFMS